MDNTKIGELIYRLRKEQGMTQLQLAEKLCVSDKAVSKWERGLGCPDVSLLTDLSDIFNIDLEQLLSGELNPNPKDSGNVKKQIFISARFAEILLHLFPTQLFHVAVKS